VSWQTSQLRELQRLALDQNSFQMWMCMHQFCVSDLWQCGTCHLQVLSEMLTTKLNHNQSKCCHLGSILQTIMTQSTTFPLLLHVVAHNLVRKKKNQKQKKMVLRHWALDTNRAILRWKLSMTGRQWELWVGPEVRRRHRGGTH